MTFGCVELRLFSLFSITLFQDVHSLLILLSLNTLGKAGPLQYSLKSEQSSSPRSGFSEGSIEYGRRHRQIPQNLLVLIGRRDTPPIRTWALWKKCIWKRIQSEAIGIVWDRALITEYEHFLFNSEASFTLQMTSYLRDFFFF